MKLSISNIFLGFVFVCAAVLITYGGYRLFMRSAKPKVNSVALKLYGVRKHDQEVLKTGTAEPKNIAISLKRYSSQNLPGAEEYIKYYLKDKRQEVATAALEASGAFKWADLDQFETALQSGDFEIQKAALRGLAKRPAPDRVRIIRKFLEQNQASKDAQFRSLSALYRSVIDEQEKEDVKLQLLGLATNSDPEMQKSIYLELFELRPRDSQLAQLAESILQQTKDDVLAAKALRYLLHDSSPGFPSRFSKLPMRKGRVYQMTVVDFLQAHCPEGWEHVAAQVTSSEPHPHVLEAVSALEPKCR